jgi:anti-sigma B factor antagonist
MDIVRTSLAGAPLLRILGEIDHFASLTLDDAVQDALASGGAHVLLDLSACTYLDSGGLGVILASLPKVRGRGWLGVLGPNPDLRRLFVISGLTAAPEFRVFETEEQALAALAAEEG